MHVVGVALMLVLPQLAGFAAARWWRRSVAWPLIAGTTFAMIWYARLWAPAAAAAAQRAAHHGCTCGEWAVVDLVLLVAGLGFHLGGGSFLSWLDRRARRAVAVDGNPSP
jgi:hypothetical protein